MSHTVASEDVLLGAWGRSLALTRKESGIAILTMNTPGRANTLTKETIDHLSRALDMVDSDEESKGLIFMSSKKDMFVAGADIKEILACQSKAEANSLASTGHDVLKKIRSLSKPSVAAIHGICLGGGLELAICADLRIATNHDMTLLGLPEVNIGLIPGLGGTQRLPRLIGLRQALELILSGQPIASGQAHEIGLVDLVVDQEDLLSEAEKRLLELIEQGFDRSRTEEERARAVDESDGGDKKRQSLLKMSARMVRMKTGGHYPAPKLVLDVIKKGLDNGIDAGSQAEIEIFSEMAVSSIAKNMINVYFTREMAAQTAQRAIDKFGTARNISILGTGNMGMGLAGVAIESGIKVFLKGSSVERTRRDVEELTRRMAARDAGNSLVASLDDLEKLDDVQFVIESVYEDTDIKKQVISELSDRLPADCIIASNTSSLQISELAESCQRPENFLGLHFFYPIDRMPLVEVVTHENTSPEAHKRALALAGQLGKVPISVKDSPGFLVNRLLSCFLLEASKMVDEGVPVNWIEEVATSFGMPLGPFELFDELGWGLTISVGQLLHTRFGDRLKPPSLMKSAQSMNLDGKRTNAGAYKWENSTRKLSLNEDFLKHCGLTTSEEAPAESDSRNIENRLILPMIDEAARCLEEKVVRKARDIDLAIIIGAGFPPFRGGLLRYADELGIDYIVGKLEGMQERTNRDVCGLLLDMNKIGRRFYSLS